MVRPRKKLPLSLFLALLLTAVFSPAVPADETLTISTYYPSPYGIYNEMRAKRVAIGDDYINSTNYTWEETDGDGGEVDYQADLIVQGNVGIGTANPATALDLNGALSMRGMSAPYTAPSGQGRIYFDSSSSQFKVSKNGGSYNTLGGVSYTLYCFDSTGWTKDGAPLCPASVTIGTQGPCDSGFVVSKYLGQWGMCGCHAYGGCSKADVFLPPGATGCIDTNYGPGFIGKAYVCSGS